MKRALIVLLSLAATSAFAIDAAEFAARRARLAKELGPNAMLVVFSAKPAIRNNDVEYPFRQSDDLLYLTGITQNWANMWLNEGFAEFLPGQYWGAKLGPRAEDDYYVDEYTQFMGIDGRRRMPLAARASNNIYPKGALVLRMLQRYLGPERFWASLHTYLTRNALGNATSDDLRQAVLAATGEN